MAARFYCPIPLSVDEITLLPEEVAQHAGRALRLREGSEIILFNGEGGQYHAKLQFDNKKAYGHIFHFNPIECESQAHITLFQALPSGDKMDWIIEKAVELGVKRIIPIQAERSIIQLQGSRLEKRYEHWKKVAISASEQCGRNQLIDIHPLYKLGNLLADKHLCQNSFVCNPENGESLSQIAQESTTQIGFFIGPEGGWSQEELNAFKHAHIPNFKFGSRVLRTETAGLAFSAAFLALRQDI